jgi:hypothetical protein
VLPRTSIAAVGLCFIILFGCEQPPAEDGRDDAFMASGKADTGGLVEGSAEAAAVLRVANECDLATLDDTNGVGLAHNAALNIAAHKLGGDGQAGTADDAPFETLADLDAVPYVGPIAFGKLLAYAKKLGAVTSTTVPATLFDDSLAAGKAITQAEALARFAPGSTRAKLGGFVIHQRYRPCNEMTGCQSWSNLADVTFALQTYQLWNPGPGWSNQKACFQFQAASFPASERGSMALVIRNAGAVDLELKSSYLNPTYCAGLASPSAACGAFTSSIPATQLQPVPSCTLPNPAGSGMNPEVYPATVPLADPDHSEGWPLALRVLVTNQYVYARQGSRSATAADGSYTEVEYALYGVLNPGDPLPAGEGGTTCTKTTCAAQGATCNRVSDGCGGTLFCGSCSYPYQCSAANQCLLPPDCNLQPCYAGATVAYTCCGPGRVTCSNGQGCTCYDACY